MHSRDEENRRTDAEPHEADAFRAERRGERRFAESRRAARRARVLPGRSAVQASAQENSRIRRGGFQNERLEAGTHADYRDFERSRAFRLAFSRRARRRFSDAVHGARARALLLLRSDQTPRERLQHDADRDADVRRNRRGDLREGRDAGARRSREARKNSRGRRVRVRQFFLQARRSRAARNYRLRSRGADRRARRSERIRENDVHQSDLPLLRSRFGNGENRRRGRAENFPRRPRENRGAGFAVARAF